MDSKAAFDKKARRFEYDVAVYLACKLWSKKESTTVYTYDSFYKVYDEAKRDVHVYNLF